MERSTEALCCFIPSAGRAAGEAGRRKQESPALPQGGQDCADLPADADGPLLHRFGAECVRQIDADITGRGVLRGQFPEGVFDDGRRIASHAQFQIDHLCSSMPPKETLVAGISGIPALVLDKGVVAPQVHGHGLAADRAMRDKFRGDTHIVLLRHHAPDS